MRPSMQPISHPTMQPTRQPSNHPTSLPTNPTGQPTTVPTGAPTVTVQHNYCAQLGQILNITSPIDAQSALAGEDVLIGVNTDADPSMLSFAEGSTTPNGGFLYLIHQEIAKRGGFNIKYVRVDDFGKYQSTDDFLKAVLQLCDVYAGSVVGDTVRR